MTKWFAAAGVAFLIASLASCTSWPIKEVPYYYNFTYKTQPIKAGESVGVLVYEDVSLLKGRPIYQKSTFLQDASILAVQICGELGFPVKILDMNFFTLRHKYPEAAKILKENFSATGKVDFDALLEKATQKESDFATDVEIKKDLNRIRDDLGIRYLIIIGYRGPNPSYYRTAVIDFTTYTFVLNQSALTRWEVFYRLIHAFVPGYRLEHLKTELRQILQTIVK
ncbi:MAG: hypothetical protein J0L75_11100 [Spirochaetes bacterium]|nr:hypothetical protein [Spirochaetota bacterium]